MPEDKQRVAIVTGAAQGIGAAVAHRLGQEGIAVAVLDRNAEGAERSAQVLVDQGIRAIAVAVDVAVESSVESAVADVVAKLGEPEILVNNAGVLRDNLLFRMTGEDWDTVLQVHLRGAFLMSRVTQSYMVSAGWGRIINLSSTSALGNRGQANYSAAKAGIQGFTKTLAWELGPFGVTVNAVAPGFIATEMTRSTADRVGVTFEALQADAASSTAVKRVGAPADVAEAVAFFASSGAGFISGQVLYVAGGPHG